MTFNLSPTYPRLNTVVLDDPVRGSSTRQHVRAASTRIASTALGTDPAHPWAFMSAYRRRPERSRWRVLGPWGGRRPGRHKGPLHPAGRGALWRRHPSCRRPPWLPPPGGAVVHPSGGDCLSRSDRMAERAPLGGRATRPRRDPPAAHHRQWPAASRPRASSATPWPGRGPGAWACQRR